MTLERRTKSVIIPVQEQALRMKVIASNMYYTTDDQMCRLCGKGNKRISHISSVAVECCYRESRKDDIDVTGSFAKNMLAMCLRNATIMYLTNGRRSQTKINLGL